MCEASAVALEFISSLVPLVATIRIADPDLASQLRRAATSAALNTAEAWRRDGRDRAMRFRIAAGVWVCVAVWELARTFLKRNEP